MLPNRAGRNYGAVQTERHCAQNRHCVFYDRIEQEKNNPTLKGALPDNYYSRLGIDTAKLASLLDEINKIELTKDNE